MRRKPTLREVQMTQLQILKDVVEVCDRNEIQYFLNFGTAIGAVRHSGFIPWDDDIDIGMARADYERFLTIAPKELDEKYCIQSLHSHPNSPYIFTKIRLNNTVYRELATRKLKIHSGIFIDIFPYDNISDDELERRKHFKRTNLWIRLFLWRSIPDRSIKTERSIKSYAGHFARKLVHWILRVVPRSFIVDKLEKLMNEYNTIRTESIVCFLSARDYGITRDDIFPVKQLEFEGYHFSVPNDIDSFLTKIYGDYMTPPPPERRKRHAVYELEL